MDPLLVVLSTCGLGVVCLGFLVIMAVLVLRFTGRNLLESVGGLGGIVGALAGVGEEDADLVDARRSRRSTPRRDLRADAQAVDFQATVQKYRSGEVPPRAQAAPPRPSAPSAFEPDPPDDSRLRRRRSRDTEDDEGLLGGLMDDGDGPI